MPQIAHTAELADVLLISADSHVIEPVELWEDLLPAGFWGDAPKTFSQRPGGFDPKARVDEMATDRVSAEVLYPSLGLKLFALEDPALQESCFALYNDWLAEYCAAADAQLVGIGSVSAYEIDHAVEEARRCAGLGLRGIQVWQTPHPDLPFTSAHYDPLWAVCSELGMPVSLHILSGFDYSRDIYRQGQNLVEQGIEMFRLSINLKLQATMESLMAIMLSGALDRFPELQLVLVENEVAWLPFVVDQMDYYYQRFQTRTPLALSRLPSQCFADQVHATFFRDPNVAIVVDRFGAGNVLWSSDYPHGNSTWPDSQKVVAEKLGRLEPALLEQVTSTNCKTLYRM